MSSPSEEGKKVQARMLGTVVSQQQQLQEQKSSSGRAEILLPRREGLLRDHVMNLIAHALSYRGVQKGLDL